MVISRHSLLILYWCLLLALVFLGIPKAFSTPYSLMSSQCVTEQSQTLSSSFSVNH